MAVPALLLAALAAASAARGPFIEVHAWDGAGAASPALTTAVERALVLSGTTVLVGPDARKHCGARCVRVVVHQEADAHFRVEARRQGARQESSVALPGEASTFEQARTLAIQARFLIDALPPPAEPAPPPAVKVAAVLVPPAALAPPAPEAALPPPDPAPVAVAEAPAPVVAPAPAPAEPPPAAALPSAAPVAELPVDLPAPSDRLALGVAVTVLGGRGLAGSLEEPHVTTGFSLTARMSFGSFETRLRFTALDEEKGYDAQGIYEQRPRLTSLTGSLPLPWVEGLRFAAGFEMAGVLFSRFDASVRKTREPVPVEVKPDGFAPRFELTQHSDEWAPGAVAGLEHRFTLWKAAVSSSVHVAWHPGDPAPAVFPAWSFGATLGLEFGVF